MDSPRAAGMRDSYLNERGFAVLDACARSRRSARAASRLSSLAWLRRQPTVVAPIASATSLAQLTQLTESVALALSDDELARLDAVSAGLGG